MPRFITIIGLILCTLVVRAHAEDFVLIRNAKSPGTQLSKADVRALYTGKTKMFGNDVATVIVPNDDTPAFAAFSDRVFDTTTKTLLSKIKQEVFKGDMKKPATVGSAAECIAFVKKSAGGVCVVDADSAKSLPDGVAVLKFNK